VRTTAADPTSENSGRTHASVFDKAARGSSEPFSGMQWWQEIFQSKPLMENLSSHVSLADVYHIAIGGAAGLDEMVLMAS
jgi:hypothetical protein